MGLYCTYGMPMIKGAIYQLDSIIWRYKKMPSKVFLVYDAYIDRGRNDVSLVFEIRDYDERLKDEAVVSESVRGERRQSASVKGITTSEPNKKYRVMTGDQIALRAKHLKHFLLHFCIQAPGKLPDDSHHALIDLKGRKILPAESAAIEKLRKSIACDRKEGCTIIEYCPKKSGIRGLAYCGNRILPTKALQTVLLNLGYGDEMFYEKFRDDGIYGKRTRLAVSSFCGEINFHEKLYTIVDGRQIETTLDTSGDTISPFIADLIGIKCEKGQERRTYYDFDAPSWDLSRDMQLDLNGVPNELLWLKWRRHISQLQNDMICFKFGTREDFILDDRMTVKGHIKDLGFFGDRTFDAVKRFQEEAAKGARFDAIRQELVYREEATFNGAANGIADTETKDEIKRWYDFAKATMRLKIIAIGDDAPTADLSGMEILAPALGCASLCKPGQETSVLVAIPEGTTEEQLRANLTLFLFFDRPLDPDRPFAFDQGQDNIVPYLPEHGREYKYELRRIAPVTDSDSGMGRLYRGTAKGNVFTSRAEHLDYDFEQYLEVNYDPTVKEAIRKKIGNIFDRKYEGAIQSMTTKKKKLLNLIIALKEDVSPGIYLLRVKGSIDFSPHPIRVFEKEKSEYAVAHLTDIHFATRYDEGEIAAYDPFEYNNPNDRLRDFVRSLKKQNNRREIDFVIITGDIIDYCNHHRPFDYEERDGKRRWLFNEARNLDANWRALHTLLTNDPGIPIPFYISLGNHDLRHNPPSLQNVGNELNLDLKDTEKYPYDLRDTEKFSTIFSEWLWHRYFSDVLLADENAAAFYFHHFCPFSDFNITVDNLNFILMNTGTDKNIFFNDFLHNLDEAVKYLKEIISGNLPPPISVGFNADQCAWLGKTLAERPGGTNVLCLHTPIVNPSIQHVALMEKTIAEQGAATSIHMGGEPKLFISDIEGWGKEDFLDREGWLSDDTTRLFERLAGTPPRNWIPYSDEDFEYIAHKKKMIDDAVEAATAGTGHSGIVHGFKRSFSDFDLHAIKRWKRSPLYKNLTKLYQLKTDPVKRLNESSIDKGRMEVIENLRNGKIKLALTGHTHTNMEVRVERKNGRIRFFVGDYSDSEKNYGYFNGDNDALLLSTISGGFLGRDYYFPWDEKPDNYNLKDHTFRNEYFRAGFRGIRLSSDGQIHKFDIYELRR